MANLPVMRLITAVLVALLANHARFAWANIKDTVDLTTVIEADTITTLSDVLVFEPPKDYIIPRTLYARSVQLPNGDLLSTWENYNNETLEHTLVYFPIFKSVDNGRSWFHFSNCTDQVNGWGLRYQPFLYLLPYAIGSLPVGTLLLAGNSIPTNLSATKLDLYASHDSGFTWEFVSSIARGGEAIPNNGLTPVWEPFLLAYEGSLVCFYSDQRDPKYGQKLVHQVSNDAVTWGAIVDDVTYDTYTDRPGMTTVTKLPDDNYMMTYEYGGGPGFSTYMFPVYYKIAPSPLLFENVVGLPIKAPGSDQPTSSPYVTWSPTEGVNGTIVVSCGNLEQIFINRALGAVDAWEVMEVPLGASYTRSLRILDEDGHLLVIGGGPLGGSMNNVSLSIVDIH